MTDVSRDEIESEIADAVADCDGVEHTVDVIYDVGPGDSFTGEVGGLHVRIAGGPEVDYGTVEDLTEAVEAVFASRDVETSRKREAEAFDATSAAKGGPYVELLTGAVVDIVAS